MSYYKIAITVMTVMLMWCALTAPLNLRYLQENNCVKTDSDGNCL